MDDDVWIAMFARDFFGFGASGMCVATGQSFPDALDHTQRLAPVTPGHKRVLLT